MAESNLRVPAAGGTGEPSGSPASGNFGFFELRQAVVLNANGNSAVSATLYVPNANPQYFPMVDSFVIDATTLFNAVTSATLTIGTTPGGSDLASGISVWTGAPVRLAYIPTATQAVKWQNIGTNTVYFTITPAGGSNTQGKVTVYMYYVIGPGLNPVITS
jgi:hypothetical protein